MFLLKLHEYWTQLSNDSRIKRSIPPEVNQKRSAVYHPTLRSSAWDPSVRLLPVNRSFKKHAKKGVCCIICF